MARTTGKEKIDVKTFVKPKDRRKENGRYKHYWRRGLKRQNITKWERNE